MESKCDWLVQPVWEAKNAIIKTLGNMISCHKVPHDLPSDAYMTSKHGGEEWKKQHKDVEKAQAVEGIEGNKADGMA